MMQMCEMLGQELQQISGVNEELLGSAEDDKAGILATLRQGAGLTTLQTLFDHLDRSQKMLGELHMDIIQSNWTPGKVKRIVNDKPDQQFYNRAFGKYDCVVEEAPLTATQKQLALQKALYLREIGVPISTEYLIEHMNLPDKEEVIQSTIAQEEMQQKAQMAQMQSQIQQQQVLAQAATAEANSKNALAAERMNKVKLDAALSAERIQRADEDRTSSALNLIKALKELQGMDLDNLQRELSLVQQLTPEKVEMNNSVQKQESVA
jgi:hypothetical protein